MGGGDENKPVDSEVFLLLKHDIKNQLSNIQLALEGLKYELPDTDGDHTLYIDSLSKSARKIDELLDSID
jgi:nitrogen-specific signal transduction histidine kinase